MFRHALAVLLLCSFTLTITGCGSPRSERPKPKPSVMDNWEAGQAFFGENVSEGIDMPAQMGDWKTAAKYLKDPAFKTGLDAFGAASLPSGFDDDARKTAKDTVVAKYNELITEANGGADKKKMKATYDELQAALKTLTARN